MDTGAQVNVIPLHTFNRLQAQCKLTPTKHSLTGYGGQMLTVKGTCALPCRYKDKETLMNFYIVNTQAPPVLGLKACLDLDLIKLVLSVNALKEDKSVMEEYADVFDGIGLFPGECTIHLKPDATPVVYPPRRIPLALRGRLKEELQKYGKTRSHSQGNRAHRLGKCTCGRGKTENRQTQNMLGSSRPQ